MTLWMLTPGYWIGEAVKLFLDCLWDLCVWAFKFAKWFFLLDWWQPTTFIGKLMKPPTVVWLNIPGSVPATAAYLALKAGLDPSVIPFVSPEMAATVMQWV